MSMSEKPGRIYWLNKSVPVLESNEPVLLIQADCFS